MKQMFDARELAIGWLSVAIASGSDPDTPALNHTISIERYDVGVRLVATDRYVLLHAFVPDVNHKASDEPPLDIGTEDLAVAIDVDRRAQSLLAYLLKLANAIEKAGSGEQMPTVDLALNVVDVDEQGQVFAGLETRFVVLDYPDHERVQLDVYDGSFPSWRAITYGFVPKSTKAIAINPNLFGRLGPLGKLHNNRPVLWHFGGEDKAALLTVADEFHPTSGVVMPMRWEFEQPGGSE